MTFNAIGAVHRSTNQKLFVWESLKTAAPRPTDGISLKVLNLWPYQTTSMLKELAITGEKHVQQFQQVTNLAGAGMKNRFVIM
jgi:hypothetical protein